MQKSLNHFPIHEPTRILDQREKEHQYLLPSEGMDQEGQVASWGVVAIRFERAGLERLPN
jgi:hypothetical protein